MQAGRYFRIQTRRAGKGTGQLPPAPGDRRSFHRGGAEPQTEAPPPVPVHTGSGGPGLEAALSRLGNYLIPSSAPRQARQGCGAGCQPPNTGADAGPAVRPADFT